MLRSWVREGKLLPEYFSEGKVLSQFRNQNYIQYTSKTFPLVDSRSLLKLPTSVFFLKVLYTYYNLSSNSFLPSSTSIIRFWKYLCVCLKICKYLKYKSSCILRDMWDQWASEFTSTYLSHNSGQRDFSQHSVFTHPLSQGVERSLYNKGYKYHLLSIRFNRQDSTAQFTVTVTDIPVHDDWCFCVVYFLHNIVFLTQRCFK
jgi:hypothetical protein